MTAMSDPTSTPAFGACRGEPRAPHRRSGSCARPVGHCPSTGRLRADVPMLEACRTPDLVCEITLQPVRRHGVDAAILFSDIVVPLAAAGVDLDIKPGVGPVVAKPVATMDDVAGDAAAARRGRSDSSPRRSVCSSRELGDTPLIGFAGAPFTLASYLDRGRAVADVRQDQGAHVRRAGRLARAVRPAGHRSRWSSCGCRRRPGSARCSSSTPGPGRCPRPTTAGSCRHTPPRSSVRLAAEFPDRPRIHFGVGTGELLTAMARGRAPTWSGSTGAPRWTSAARRIGPSYAVQGNLDPCVLFAPWPAIEAEVRRVLARGRRPRPGTCSTSATACCPRPTQTC